MDFLTVLLLIIFVISTCYLLSKRSTNNNLPPGPFPIPIIGNLFQLGKNPHKALAKLSKTYGPLMHLKLGSKHTIVISSPEMAKEVLQKHDQLCSGRAVPNAARAMNHHEASLAWLPVGIKWRQFRKICKEEMFSIHQLNASQGLRKEKLQQLHTYIQDCCSSGRLVNIGEVAFITTLNLISATIFSVDFAQFDSGSTQEMKETIQHIMKISAPTLADYFPILKFIDPQGIQHESEIYLKKLLSTFEELVCQRLKSRSISLDYSRKKDLLEALLDLNQEKESSFSQNDINHLLVDLIIAGSDTTTDLVQWAMAELLRDPEKMSKAKDELRTVIGENKQIEESEISKLSYLCAVIKETLRLHPLGPFLVPHKAEGEVKITGDYLIPKDAEILVNVWAIGRDSRIWSNPDSFEPERFLDGKMDYRGQDFEFIPFGSGRRMCPGMSLAHIMVHLMLAYLIHNFDWELEAGMQPNEMDMNEMFGLSLHKAVPLRAFQLNM